jgi:hypothetical protein
MGTQVVPLCLQAYQARASDAAAVRSLNLYLERMPQPESKVGDVLIGTPGIELFTDIGGSTTNSCRGLYRTSTGRTFGAYGTALWEIFANGTQTKRLNLAAQVSRVVMQDDGTTMLIADGYGCLAYALATNSTTAVSFPDPFYPTWIGYIGKRMVGIDGSADYRWSDINQPTVWNALSVDEADTFADELIAARVIRDELWLWGPRSYEVRRLTDDPQYPFRLVGGSAGEIGCGSPNSVTKIGDVVYWLGSSTAGEGIVYRSNGYSAEAVSNPAISYQIGQLPQTSDAVGWAYQEEGHVFYVLTFIQGDRTFVFDATTGAWHERSSRNPTTNTQHRWSPLYAVHTDYGTLLGSQAGPFVLRSSLDVFTEYYDRTHTAQTVPRILDTPHYWSGMDVVSIDEFALDIGAGVGLQAGQGSDPQVMLQLSKDGGHTWGSERWRSFGLIGQYDRRVAWRMLGRSRSLMVRLQVSDPVRVHIIGARMTTAVLEGAR